MMTSEVAGRIHGGRSILDHSGSAFVVEIILRASPSRSRRHLLLALRPASSVELVIARSLPVGARHAEDGEESHDANGDHHARHHVNAEGARGGRHLLLAVVVLLILRVVFVSGVTFNAATSGFGYVVV